MIISLIIQKRKEPKTINIELVLPAKQNATIVLDTNAERSTVDAETLAAVLKVCLKKSLLNDLIGVLLKLVVTNEEDKIIQQIHSNGNSAVIVKRPDGYVNISEQSDSSESMDDVDDCMLEDIGPSENPDED